MKSSHVLFEGVLEKTIARYSLKQVEDAIHEIKIHQRQFRKFEFKKQGLHMTAVDFFSIKSKLSNSLKILKKRHREILKNPEVQSA